MSVVPQQVMAGLPSFLTNFIQVTSGVDIRGNGDIDLAYMK
jgi:hypothetical protein